MLHRTTRDVVNGGRNEFTDNPCFFILFFLSPSRPRFASLLPHILYIGEIYIKKEYKQKENLGMLNKMKKNKIKNFAFRLIYVRRGDRTTVECRSVFALKQVPFCVLLNFFFSF